MRADELSMLLTSQWGPYLEQALKRYGQSMTPEGKARLAAAFKQRAIMSAQETGGMAASGLRSQGFSPGYAAGVGLNAYSQAQRASTAYDAHVHDPASDAMNSLGIFSGIAGHSPAPPPPGGSLLGDIAGIAGTFFGGGSHGMAGSGGGGGTLPTQGSLGNLARPMAAGGFSPNLRLPETPTNPLYETSTPSGNRFTNIGGY